MTKRYAGEPLEKPIVPPGSSILLRGGDKPHPLAKEMAKAIEDLKQKGTRVVIEGPNLIRYFYDSYDDLEAIAGLLRKTRGNTWRF